MTDEENPRNVSVATSENRRTRNARNRNGTTITRDELVTRSFHGPFQVDPPAPSARSTTDNASDLESRNAISRCIMCISQKLHRLLVIITYPFMLLFTMVSIIMIIIFCIIPTIFCMSLGICAYYCFMEDPIPLNLLLRYMFSPDGDAQNAFPTSTGSYPFTQNRGAIQSKLIVRRLVQISSYDPEDHDIQKYPRRHPFPIRVSTESKCLHFSEPLVTEDDDEDDIKKKTKQKRPRPLNSDDDTGDNDSATDPPAIHISIPHYQRSAEHQLSSMNLAETVPEILPVERDGTSLPLGGSTEISTEDQDEESSRGSVAEDEKEDIEDIGPVEIKVGRPEGDEERGDEEAGEYNDGTNDETDKKKDDIEDPPHVSANLGGDYFGIENDVRDRGTTCDICLLDYEVGDRVAWSPNLECSHTYHKDCVLDWLVRKPTCPNCRHDYLKGKKDQNV
mmetsp:Transcript_24546/g.43069  ORF Transcript_24546/g.43069 Transcript_24546/m.43069 type:complete len:449 (-) Transcript_24546:151-1497(-)